MSIENIFIDSSFHYSSTQCYPNRLYGDGKEIGAVVVTPSRRGDCQLRVAGLDYVVKAEAEGRIKEGFVVLAKLNSRNVLKYVRSARASEVAERLRNVTPRESRLGTYYWITERLHAVGEQEAAVF